MNAGTATVEALRAEVAELRAEVERLEAGQLCDIAAMEIAYEAGYMAGEARLRRRFGLPADRPRRRRFTVHDGGAR